MTFARRLQAFLDELRSEGTPVSPIEAIRAFMLQLAASASVASEKSGEDLDKILDAICDNLRATAHRCTILENERKN